jgi:hypothetical protein
MKTVKTNMSKGEQIKKTEKKQEVIYIMRVHERHCRSLLTHRTWDCNCRKYIKRMDTVIDTAGNQKRRITS